MFVNVNMADGMIRAEAPIIDGAVSERMVDYTEQHQNGVQVVLSKTVYSLTRRYSTAGEDSMIISPKQMAPGIFAGGHCLQ